MGLKLRFTKERLFISFYQVEEKSKFHFHERKGKERRIFLLFGQGCGHKGTFERLRFIYGSVPSLKTREGYRDLAQNESAGYNGRALTSPDAWVLVLRILLSHPIAISCRIKKREVASGAVLSVGPWVGQRAFLSKVKEARVGSLVNPLKAACILSPNWLLRLDSGV